MKEKDKIPVGLTIKNINEACDITITLGDDVNLKQIVDYLFDNEHITHAGQDKEGIYKLANDATKITIKMCGQDQNDTYSVKMLPGKYGTLFMYNKKDKLIACDGDKIKKITMTTVLHAETITLSVIK